MTIIRSPQCPLPGVLIKVQAHGSDALNADLPATPKSLTLGGTLGTVGFGRLANRRF